MPDPNYDNLSQENRDEEIHNIYRSVSWWAVGALLALMGILTMWGKDKFDDFNRITTEQALEIREMRVELREFRRNQTDLMTELLNEIRSMRNDLYSRPAGR